MAATTVTAPAGAGALGRKWATKWCRGAYADGSMMRHPFSPTMCVHADTLVTVSWRVRHRCRFGERVAIIGGHEHLGAWQPHRSVALSWTEGDDWVGKAMFTPG